MTTATETGGVPHRGGLIALLDGTLERVSRRGPEAELSGDGKLDTTLGALIDALDERAFGLLLLMLAVPCCIPFLYGLPQVVAFPMLAVAGQIAQGRETPWLPAKLKTRRLDVGGMRGVLARVARYLGWIERLAKPRLRGLTEGVGLRIVGAVMLIPILSILSPIPLSNTPPGVGVAVAAVGILERDGLLTLAGLAFATLWAVALFGAIAFFGFEAVDLVKDWIKGLIGAA